MNNERRERLAARFARAWKRRIRDDEGRWRRRRNQAEAEARDAEFVPGVSERRAMVIAVWVASAIVAALLLYRMFSPT